MLCHKIKPNVQKERERNKKHTQHFSTIKQEGGIQRCRSVWTVASRRPFSFRRQYQTTRGKSCPLSQIPMESFSFVKKMDVITHTTFLPLIPPWWTMEVVGHDGWIELFLSLLLLFRLLLLFPSPPSLCTVDYDQTVKS